MSTPQNRSSLLIKGILGALSQVLIFAILLLVPAGLVPEGTWIWKRGIQFLFLYGFLVLTSVFVLFYLAPEGLEGRLQGPFGEGQEKKDRLATRILVVAMLLWVVFIPLDVFMFKLLNPPTYTMSIVGLLIFLEGFVIIGLTIYQNTFAIPYVKDQSDKGQYLVDTGLYAMVRHPMYMGFLVLFLGMALWLGSYAGGMAVILVLFSFIPRILEEEKYLNNQLKGYPEYQHKVKYRLIPFVW